MDVSDFEFLGNYSHLEFARCFNRLLMDKFIPPRNAEYNKQLRVVIQQIMEELDDMTEKINVLRQKLTKTDELLKNSETLE